MSHLPNVCHSLWHEFRSKCDIVPKLWCCVVHCVTGCAWKKWIQSQGKFNLTFSLDKNLGTMLSESNLIGPKYMASLLLPCLLCTDGYNALSGDRGQTWWLQGWTAYDSYRQVKYPHGFVNNWRNSAYFNMQTKYKMWYFMWNYWKDLPWTSSQEKDLH